MPATSPSSSLHLTVLTPESTVANERVDSLRCVAIDGELGVLPGHQPLVTPLQVGVLRIRQGGIEKRLAVMGGLLSTDGQQATILTDGAEWGDTVDRVRAEEARKRAELRLSQQEAGVDMDRAELALKRAITRIQASRNS